MSRTVAPARAGWPELAYEDWKDTLETLHLWTQVVGKVRLVQTPWINHSWHVPLYVTARGLTTSPIPYGARTFEIAFDFIDHRLRIDTDDGGTAEIPLRPQTVADFYREVIARARRARHRRRASARCPNEIPDAIPFEQDRAHAGVRPGRRRRASGARSCRPTGCSRRSARGSSGKCSPVHFFWGSFDLAVTRFSGRPAPPHPGGVPNLPGLGRPRGVLPRGEQRGVLAGRRAASRAGLLLLRLSRAARASGDAPVPPAAARFDTDPRASSCSPTTRFAPPPTRTPRCSSFSRAPTRRRRSGRRWDREALEAALPEQCFRYAPADPR